jgi:hypothetical protein
VLCASAACLRIRAITQASQLNFPLERYMVKTEEGEPQELAAAEAMPPAVEEPMSVL